MISPIEPLEGYIGSGTEKYHNEFVGTNFLAFRLDENGKYEFLAEEGYFMRSSINKDNPQNYYENDDFKGEIKEMYQYFELTKENFAKYGGLVNNHNPEYRGKVDYRNFLQSLGTKLYYGNWALWGEEHIPPAFTMIVQDPNGDKGLPNNGIEITYQGNPFYAIADTEQCDWCDSGGLIIMFYEPVSRIVLFTFEY